jgi:hypothetical protein
LTGDSVYKLVGRKTLEIFSPPLKNCEYGQGFYYSRPVGSLFAAEMIDELARKNEFPIPSAFEIGQAGKLSNQLLIGFNRENCGVFTARPGLFPGIARRVR